MTNVILDSAASNPTIQLMDEDLARAHTNARIAPAKRRCRAE